MPSGSTEAVTYGTRIGAQHLTVRLLLCSRRTTPSENDRRQCKPSPRAFHDEVHIGPRFLAYNDPMNPFNSVAARRCRPVAGLALITLLVLTTAPASAVDERRLSFYHTHTGERLDVVYARGGAYLEPALDEIETFLSDFRTGDARTIDPELLDIIHDLRESLGGRGTYEVISAYRSPKTNEMLRQRSGGVARNSQHLLGKAIDVRLTGVELVRLRDAAVSLQRGGVGYYPESDFVHIDTGRVRRW